MSDKPAYENKPNTFSLFINKYKVAGDNKPDMRGSYYTVDLVEMDCVAWRKKTKSGDTWYSGKISPKQPKQGAPRPAPAQTEESDW